MNTHIALLRGINVGGHNSLPMNELTSILEEIGFENIKTYIQSGNVVFQSIKETGNNYSEEIGKAIEHSKGYRPGVMLLSLVQ